MVKKKNVENMNPGTSRSQTLAYIVDLPRDDDEADRARTKFETAVEGLRKVYPMISEARATVKVSSPMGERKRFEVQAFVKMPKHQYEFGAEGWSLAETFDEIGAKLRRLKVKTEKKQTYRRHMTRADREARLTA